MDCVVTGGAGFIGSNLVDALLARGDRVTVIDNLATGKRENLQSAVEAGAVLEIVDVRDPHAVAAIFERDRPELVFHLAAQASVINAIKDPVTDAAVNVIGTINVLEAARLAGTRRVVNTSTGGGLYGDADLLPTPEGYRFAVLAPYGQSKYAAEGYCELFGRLHGLATVSLRYGNVYGPRQDPYGEGGVVAIFCDHVITGATPTVFGDGRQTRDWVDVSDVVRANLLAAESELSGPINIGHGLETSVLELLEALNEVAARPPAPPQFVPPRHGEVKRSCLDVSRARDELGWEPAVALHDGLRAILAGR